MTRGHRGVRRLAQGRARHGAQHRALRRDASGARPSPAHMRAVKALIDPHGVLSPGVVLTDDPKAHLKQPQDGADHRGGRRPLHRVRVLRERLPEPPGDDHAPPAHRAAARDDAPAARGRRSPRSWPEALLLRRGRDLRRATGPARWPARWGSTPATDEGLRVEVHNPPSERGRPRDGQALPGDGAARAVSAASDGGAVGLGHRRRTSSRGSPTSRAGGGQPDVMPRWIPEIPTRAPAAGCR